jgi:hypothetical protein
MVFGRVAAEYGEIAVPIVLSGEADDGFAKRTCTAGDEDFSMKGHFFIFLSSIPARATIIRHAQTAS